MSEEREARNAVFGGMAPSAGGIQAVDRVKAELGLDIPTEIVPLPSSGKVYPVGSSLHGKDSLMIRAMTTREEDILTSRALIKKGTVITELIKSCLIDKTVDVNDMIAGDRNALMVGIRITGYGSEYDAEAECPQCNHREKHAFDLSAMPLKRLEIEPVRQGENVFQFSLPVSKKVVEFKFLTGRDEEEITVTAERMKKMGGVSDNIVTSRLKYSIVSVDGKTDKALLAAFVGKMPARDSLVLRKYIDKHEPGIDMTQSITCSNCGAEEEVQVPLGVGFFWPDA